MTVKVTVTYSVYSSVPGQVGNWALAKDFQLSRAPVPGEYIEPATGWAAERVKDVFHLADGVVHVRLVTCQTDSPVILADLHRLVTEHGWQQLGGPWKGQQP